MLNKTILITRANYESTTSYLFYWAADVLKLAQAKFTTVISIDGDKVNKKEVTGRIKKMKPDMVHFNGHGSASELFGHNNEVIIDASNSKYLQNSIVYALSCQSASTLGPLATSQGAKAYIGYRQDFIFAADNSKYAHAIDDEDARLFMEPAMKVSEGLLKGKTVDETVKTAKAAFTQSILRAASSAVQTGHSAYIPYLLWDREHLVYSGDGRASLS